MKWSRVLTASAVIVVFGCGDGGTGPSQRKVSVAASAGTDQYGTVNSTLAEPLQVVVTDPVTKRPRSGITVQWTVLQGTGASLNPATSITGENGIATTVARLGPNTGTYVFQATADNLVGTPARFEVRAVNPPVVSAISPRTANTGDTVTIAGTNFSANADENIVLFGGMRGRVTSATTSQLRVVVPACLPTRTVSVQALLGAVGSNVDSIAVRGTTTALLQLTRGDALTLSEPRDLQCQRIAPTTAALYLIVPQNFSEVVGSTTYFDLIGVSGAAGTVTTIPLGNPRPGPEFGSAWELRLRSLERQFNDPIGAPELPAGYRARPPEIGDPRSFQVFDKNDKFVKINATVKHISQRAIIYQDNNSPENGFTSADYQALGASFDNPTYDTNVAVFGAPSDIDANGKVILLLTPVVNELTPKGSSGFVAGFFFGCDLQTTRECSGSNSSEVMYGFVPDPTGKHGDSRTRDFVLRNLIPVLAHELQHLIHFGARKNLDALWLSEGLAHMAEDAIGELYAQRGDVTNATLFRFQNYSRAILYLRDSTSTSMISEELPGTLQLRGAAWLMLKYLQGHYGGNELLRKLTRTTLSSVQNVTTQTGQRWSKLMADWAVAIWADDAPELFGATVRPQYTFTNINLRQVLTTTQGYPLRPVTVGFEDFVIRGTLRASAQRHVLLDAGLSSTRFVNLALTGQRGGAFAVNATPQVTIFRAR